jgi:hypothetical protein
MLSSAKLTHGETMPRIKSTDQIASIKAKQKELADQLKAANVKARADAKAIEDRRALTAGRLVVSELIGNASGPLAAAFRAVANIKMTKSGERALFELPDLSAKSNGGGHSESVVASKGGTTGLTSGGG